MIFFEMTYEKEKDIMIENVLEKLCTLFDQNNAQYRVLHHETAGKTSQSVAEIRGTELGQGAKALCCVVKGNGIKQYVLAILPADLQADLIKLARALGGRRASLASPTEVMELTGCVFGAVPPVSFHPDMILVADPQLFSRYDELAFNAGALNTSIIIKTEDYQRSAQPKLISFVKEQV